MTSDPNNAASPNGRGQTDGMADPALLTDLTGRADLGGVGDLGGGAEIDGVWLARRRLGAAVRRWASSARSVPRAGLTRLGDDGRIPATDGVQPGDDAGRDGEPLAGGFRVGSVGPVYPDTATRPGGTGELLGGLRRRSRGDGGGRERWRWGRRQPGPWQSGRWQSGRWRPGRWRQEWRRGRRWRWWWQVDPGDAPGRDRVRRSWLAGWRSRRDRGAATIFVLGVGLVLVLAGAAGAAVGAARLSRHQAQVAADLGALAGAARAIEGAASACARAAEFVAANRARLTSCRVEGLEIVIYAEVVVSPLPGLTRRAVAGARAGPVFAPARADRRGRPARARWIEIAGR